ncbi:ABC transporter substrate-binding protein [Pollutimonas bauzanensis]|uniref:NitT/TauT family transport system substrate-binding protein n=1 Tax=Pollutimonas bauzanensis TaxID=658167 RepID=A0A1M5Y5Y2_9BURK|nr:ABC transporter substrate-binding protein [Pollutimonas bauzanensis]SHI07480.1 NitT/TauT family transport system substrate-binding protein [Pollutimonas bauzanensis]
MFIHKVATGARLRLVGMLIAGAFASLAAQAADTVTVGLAIPLTVDSGGVYGLGNELGFFKEEGIEVKTVVFQGAGAMLPQVAARKVTIGLPLPEPVLASYETGKTPLPVRYFYNAIPLNEIELAVLADSPIHSIADLKGKKIGVGALTWGTIPATRALLRQQGLTAGKDVDIVGVGVLGSGFLALKEKRVDALNFNSSWHAMLELSGTPLRRLPYPDTFRDMNSNGFVAHQDTLREQPQLLARFGRAYTKALIACEANPKLCVESFWRLQPESRPKTGDAAKQLDEAVFLVKRRMNRTLRNADGSLREFGKFNLPVIRDFVEAMYKSGEFNTANIPVDQIFDNSLVPEFAKFDVAQVQARAKAAQ